MRHGRQESSWWSRNWGWVVGIGCGCLLLPLLLVGACAGGMAWLVSSQVDTETVFGEAVEMVEADPEVRDRLGTPIEVGFFRASTQITVDEDDGRAEYSRPLSGPTGSGEMRVDARKTDGEWTIVRLVVTIDDESIDVLANARGVAPDTGASPDATDAPGSPSP